MVDWKTLKVGDKLRWFGSDFDGTWNRPCTVTAINKDCAVAVWEGVTLTVEDWNCETFKKEGQ